MISRHPKRNAVDRRLVGDFQLATERVAKQMFAEGAHEFLRPREDGVLELLDVLEVRLAKKLAARVDVTPTAVLITPTPDGIEALQHKPERIDTRVATGAGGPCSRRW